MEKELMKLGVHSEVVPLGVDPTVYSPQKKNAEKKSAEPLGVDMHSRAGALQFLHSIADGLRGPAFCADLWKCYDSCWAGEDDIGNWMVA